MKNSKVKFFLVAATLVGFSSVGSATPDQDSVPSYGNEQYNTADENLDSVGVASVVDSAVAKPYSAGCHECGTANRYSGSRGKSFEPPGLEGIEKKGNNNSTQ